MDIFVLTRLRPSRPSTKTLPPSTYQLSYLLEAPKRQSFCHMPKTFPFCNFFSSLPSLPPSPSSCSATQLSIKRGALLFLCFSVGRTRLSFSLRLGGLAAAAAAKRKQSARPLPLSNVAFSFLNLVRGQRLSLSFRPPLPPMTTTATAPSEEGG